MTIEEAERHRATLLCRYLAMRERTRANMAPEISDTKMDLAWLDLERAERELRRLASRG